MRTEKVPWQTPQNVSDCDVIPRTPPSGLLNAHPQDFHDLTRDFPSRQQGRELVEVH